MTAIEQLQVTMVELATKFQAGDVTLDDFIVDQAKLSESIAQAKADEAKARAQAIKAAREAEAGAREVVALEAAMALEGFNIVDGAVAVVTVTQGDNGPLLTGRVTLDEAKLKAVVTALSEAGYNNLTYKPVAEITFNGDGIVDVELKVKATSTAASTSGRKTATWQRGDVGPVTLAAAYDTAMDNEAKDAMLELDRRIRTGDLAKASYGNESWQIKKAAVKRHGWEKVK